MATKPTSVIALLLGLAAVTPLPAQLKPILKPIADPSLSGTTLTLLAGPAPTGIAVAGFGITATVTWQPPTSAASWVVTRWLQSDPNCCKAISAVLTPAIWTWTDAGLQWPGTYVYRVAVTYSDGRVGSADYLFTRPAPQDPGGFTGKQTGEGQVQLSWQPVPGVSTYLVGGPGAGLNGTQVTGNSVTLNSVPPGTQQWTVASLYAPGGLLTASANWPKAILAVTPTTNRYRVVLEGFRVVHPTVEDPLVGDGLGDEIYIATQVNLYDPTGLLRNTGTVTTSVFGDTHRFPNRIKAGSASLTGGLIQYDNYPPTPPGGNATVVSGLRFTVWEGDLSDAGEWIGVSPTIWEQDGSDRIFRTFAQYYVMMAGSLKSSDRLRVGREAGNWEMLRTCGGPDNSSLSPWVSPTGIGPVDVPVNTYREGWCPTWVTLNRKTFNSLLGPGPHLYQVAPALYEMRFRTDFSEYVLYFRLEKLQ